MFVKKNRDGENPGFSIFFSPPLHSPASQTNLRPPSLLGVQSRIGYSGLWLHSFVFCGLSLKMKCGKDFRVSLYSVQVHKKWFRQGINPDKCFEQARQRKERTFSLQQNWLNRALNSNISWAKSQMRQAIREGRG